MAEHAFNGTTPSRHALIEAGRILSYEVARLRAHSSGDAAKRDAEAASIEAVREFLLRLSRASQTSV